MTDDYRQKLLNWWCSILLVFLATAASLTLFWFSGRINPYNPNDTTHLVGLSGLFAEALITFPILFSPAAVWHLFDAVQRNKPDNGLLRALNSYPWFSALLALNAIIWASAASGAFTVEKCPSFAEDGGFGFYHCVYGPPDWLLYLAIALLLFALILCMGKAVISVRSRFR